MKVVYKFKLEKIDLLRRGVASLKLPKDSSILSFKEIDNDFFIWALVDTNADNENRYFLFCGTGMNISDFNIKNHIGTIKQKDFIWHLFEIEEIEG